MPQLAGQVAHGSLGENRSSMELAPGVSATVSTGPGVAHGSQGENSSSVELAPGVSATVFNWAMCAAFLCRLVHVHGYCPVHALGPASPQLRECKRHYML